MPVSLVSEKRGQLIRVLQSENRPFSLEELGQLLYAGIDFESVLRTLVYDSRKAGIPIQTFLLFGYGLNVQNPDPETFLTGDKLSIFRFVEANSKSSKRDIIEGTGINPSRATSLLVGHSPISKYLDRYQSCRCLISDCPKHFLRRWSVVPRETL